MDGHKRNIIDQLKKDILPLQGYSPVHSGLQCETGLGPILQSFPQKKFPLGAIHECLVEDRETAAATAGFITGLAGTLMGPQGVSVWISAAPKIFPSALSFFNINPGHLIFIEIQKQKDILWAVEEALKCEALTAVIAEIPMLDFTSSRRLQLAVEHSCVTGFMIRPQTRQLQTTAALCRWKISSLPGELQGDMPGLGYPQWQVELCKVRNGRPGTWVVKWINGRFYPVYREAVLFPEQKQKTG